ncbi:hypothetical protein [Micromonospora sp. SH-82]|uniref:hypothetical protein n=1 Tax=Micromonospora sp. SH-82 TaxID=3132938 RepID=UPI003EC13EDB
MNERPHEGPLPPAYPVAGGRPPLPDGDRMPCPPRPSPVSRREYVSGVAVAVVVLVLLLVGILGWGRAGW